MIEKPTELRGFRLHAAVRLRLLGIERPLLTCLPWNALNRLLSVQCVMVLDLSSSTLDRGGLLPITEGQFHVCTRISALLVTLRRLRLRMRALCPEALKPPQHVTKLNITEVLVNLSLWDQGMIFEHSRCCTVRWWS